MLLENRQDLALAWRLDQVRIVEAELHGGTPETLLARLGRLVLTQQVEQYPGQGVAKAALVALGGSATEFEQIRRHRRLGTEYSKGRLELVFGYFGTVCHLYQNANQFPAPEQRQQVNPRLQDTVWNAAGRTVVEQVAEWQRQGQAQDQVWRSAASGDKGGESWAGDASRQPADGTACIDESVWYDPRP